MLVSASSLRSSDSMTNLAGAQPFEDDTGSIRGHPVLRHKDTSGAMGMLQYKAGDEAKIIQSLIMGKCLTLSLFSMAFRARLHGLRDLTELLQTITS